MREIDEIKADDNRTIAEWLELRDHYDRGSESYSVSNRCEISDSFVDKLLDIFGPERLEEMCNAERDGRCKVIPKPLISFRAIFGGRDHHEA